MPTPTTWDTHAKNAAKRARSTQKRNKLGIYENSERELYTAMKWDFEHNQLCPDKAKYFNELKLKYG